MNLNTKGLPTNDHRDTRTTTSRTEPTNAGQSVSPGIR